MKKNSKVVAATQAVREVKRPFLSICARHRRIVRSVTPRISAAAHHVSFFAIAFNNTQEGGGVKLGGGKNPAVFVRGDGADDESATDNSCVNSTGQLTY
jgi:hypothetical protein